MKSSWMFLNTLQHISYCSFTNVFLFWKYTRSQVGGVLRGVSEFWFRAVGIHANNSRGLDRMGTWQRWLVQVTHMATGFCLESVFFIFILKMWYFHCVVCPRSLSLFGCGGVVWHSIVALIKHLIPTHQTFDPQHTCVTLMASTRPVSFILKFWIVKYTHSFIPGVCLVCMMWDCLAVPQVENLHGCFCLNNEMPT